jgi:hypothetical protein
MSERALGCPSRLFMPEPGKAALGPCAAVSEQNRHGSQGGLPVTSEEDHYGRHYRQCEKNTPGTTSRGPLGVTRICPACRADGGTAALTMT